MSKVGEFQRWGANERGWAPKTQADYGVWVRVAERWFAESGRELDAASSADVKAFVFSRSPAPRTRNALRSALLAYFDFVRSTGRRQDNPAVELQRLPERRGLPRPVASTRLPGLIAAATAGGPMLEALIKLYLYTGLRVTEGRLLGWSQIDDDWIFLTGKGGYQRRVYLNKAAPDALERWRLVCPAGPWIFPSPVAPDRPVSYSWIYRKLRRLGVEADIAVCRPHRLRYTFGTELYRRTHSILVLQTALGHATPQTSAIYALVEPAELERAMGQLSFGEEPA